MKFHIVKLEIHFFRCIDYFDPPIITPAMEETKKTVLMAGPLAGPHPMRLLPLGLIEVFRYMLKL